LRIGAGKLALTYFHTVFSKLVEAAPTISPDPLSNPEFLPYVYRNVSYAGRTPLCQRGQFMRLPRDCLYLPVAGVIDLRLSNLGVIETSGFDLNARYTFEGALEGSMSGCLELICWITPWLRRQTCQWSVF
jgi:hypothetical protein